MEKHHDKHSKRQRQDGGVCQAGKRYIATANTFDGQAATNESVYDSLAADAWFPAIYADDLIGEAYADDLGDEDL